MTISLPIESLFILYVLKKAGFEGYIVGGAVRDLLQGVPSKDIDLTTNATPEQINELFPESFYENQFGTVSITRTHTREQAGLPILSEQTLEDRQLAVDPFTATKLHSSLSIKTPVSAYKKTQEPLYEITTYRSDGVYSDHRRPETVTWGTSLEEDLKRRDFTINAMALSVTNEKLQELFETATPPNEVTLTESEYQLIDPHNGLQDLNWKLVKSVGPAAQRFQEDALRMLRAIRFAVQLGFTIDPEIVTAIKQHAELLRHISGERIRDEFFKMLLSDRPKQAILLLDQTGLLAIFLPELVATKNVQQGGHHTTDVWTHSIDALEASPSHDPVVKLATLLHDIDKPATFNKTSEGNITFYNHEVVGARTARIIGERLKLSRKDLDRIFLLVRFHMFHYQADHTDAAIRRFMRKVGLENLNDMLDLREADRLGSGAKKTSWRLEEMKQRMIEQLNQPFDVTDLAVNGTDLMKELDIPPSPMIGHILHQLLEEVLENPELNTKETLVQRAREIITS